MNFWAWLWFGYLSSPCIVSVFELRINQDLWFSYGLPAFGCMASEPIQEGGTWDEALNHSRDQDQPLGSVHHSSLGLSWTVRTMLRKYVTQTQEVVLITLTSLYSGVLPQDATPSIAIWKSWKNLSIKRHPFAQTFQEPTFSYLRLFFLLYFHVSLPKCLFLKHFSLTELVNVGVKLPPGEEILVLNYRVSPVIDDSTSL